jgi:pSer/pThr/pTyr-binding forkhead associated (FHA) protein
MHPRTPTDVQTTGAIPVASDLLQGADSPGEHPAWIEETRSGLEGPGRWLAYEEDGGERIVPLAREWTRIGRSLAADVRFDDATVSRRHALIVHQADGTRVLDDRSLNGVYVNGRRVEWSPLKDGDQIVVGRHTLVFLDTATVGQPVAAAPAAVSGE